MKKILTIFLLFICTHCQSQRIYRFDTIDSRLYSVADTTLPISLRWYPDTVEAKIAIYQKSQFSSVLKLVNGYVILDRKISYLDKHKKPFPKNIGVYSFRSKYDEDGY